MPSRCFYILKKVKEYECDLVVLDCLRLTLTGKTKGVPKELLNEIKEHKLELIRYVRGDIPCYVIERKETERSEWVEFVKFMNADMAIAALNSLKQSLNNVRLFLPDGEYYDTAQCNAKQRDAKQQKHRL